MIQFPYLLIIGYQLNSQPDQEFIILILHLFCFEFRSVGWFRPWPWVHWPC